MKTETQREDGHVKMETEIGVMLPKPKEDLELPEEPERGNGLFSKGLGGSMILPTPCFWNSSLQNCDRRH